MKIALLLLTFAACLAGCAMDIKPDDTALIAELERTTPTCRDAKECEVKWIAARQWITANMSMKIQQLTPDFLETYNPINSAELGARVEKLPSQDGSYRIKATFSCGNLFGCIPGPSETLKKFNDSVNASWRP